MDRKVKESKALTQIDKFRELARELETDDDEARFDERLKKLATGGLCFFGGRFQTDAVPRNPPP